MIFIDITCVLFVQGYHNIKIQNKKIVFIAYHDTMNFITFFTGEINLVLEKKVWKAEEIVSDLEQF